MSSSTSATPKTSWWTRLSLPKLRRAKEILPSAKVAEYPLGLSKEQVASLSQLRSSPNWAQVKEAFEAAHAFHAKDVLECVDFGRYRECVGILKAYEEMFNLLDVVVEKASQLDEHRDHVEQQRRSLERSAAATRYGSSRWKPAP